MPTPKTVTVKATMGDTFKIESTMGAHTLYIDQPKAAGGNDEGPSPLQYFFLSLGGCIASIARIKANQEKIALRGLDVEVEGTLDAEVLLGKSADKRSGFESICVKVTMDTDMSREEQEEFLKAVDARCPVSNNIEKTTPVTVMLAD